ncbi:hypothetical protein PENTCL1PPCAC_17043 [Pristionchus entomophagus]|uniref:Uncharacterized protein n=1 Tax=Pristionchus entomophagus TaxID=358040 RepID=A0AAV5TKT1_9BILA|nr:hypothetical protein PENTCL1PPCAC_17043 [Pristionchus entomophagus]
MTKSMHERLLSLFEHHSSFDSLSTVMGSGASNSVRTISLDRRKDSKYRETKSIGERFRLRKHSTGEMLEETPSSSNAKQKRIYDLSKSLENALLTINKLNKRLSVVEHEKEELQEEVTWLRKFGCRADQSGGSRQSSVSIEAGDDALRLQLRQALHDLKLVRLESMKWKEERDTMANQCTQKESRIVNLERDLQIGRGRIISLEELVRRQLGELSLGDIVFNSDSVSMTSETNKPNPEDATDQSDSVSSRAVSMISSPIDRPQSRPGPVRVLSAGRNRRDSTSKPDKITDDIDHLLGDLPSALTLEPEDATFDELKEKALTEESTRKYRQGSPRYHRSPSLTTDPPRHLPPLQKYRDKNVFALPRKEDKRPMTAAPLVERRMILGRNASVPLMESREPSVEEVGDGSDFLNIDDLLNAEEPAANIRSQSGKSRDSGFTEASVKNVVR